MRYTHTVEYYSTIKRNEVIICATTWMDLENITLRVKEAKHKGPHIAWCHLYEISRTGRLTETGSRLVVTEGWMGRVWGKWEGTANRYCGFFWGRWRCSKTDCGDDHSALQPGSLVTLERDSSWANCCLRKMSTTWPTSQSQAIKLNHECESVSQYQAHNRRSIQAKKNNEVRKSTLEVTNTFTNVRWFHNFIHKIITYIIRNNWFSVSQVTFQRLT